MLRNAGRNPSGMPVAITPEQRSQSDRNAGRNRPEYAAGGEGSAPTPFEYFLASLGTCAGIYVLSFCQQRNIATEGMDLTQRIEFEADEAGKKRLAKVMIEIGLPPGFPEKYRDAIVKAAGLCTVKKVIMDPPDFVITVQTRQ